METVEDPTRQGVASSVGRDTSDMHSVFTISEEGMSLRNRLGGTALS